MSTGVKSWSKTAANNSTADSAAPWPEGMLPGQVNDSSRGGMASVAKWRDDISGVIVTSGTASAYTVASNQNFSALTELDGMVVAFTPHATNDAAPTLSVDGLAAKPLRAAHGADLQSNVLLAGTPYVALYSNGNNEFVLQGMTANPYGIPLAGGLDYWADVSPGSAYAFPTGQAISRTAYAALFALIGTKYGSGDGTTTFNLPDKTERVSVMKAAAASRLTSAYFGGDSTQLGATGGGQNVSMALANLIQHDHTVFLHDPGHTHTTNARATVPSPGASIGPDFPAPATGATVNSATTGITLWSDGAGTGTQNKVGKTGSADPTPMNNMQPTAFLNVMIKL